MGRRRDGGFRKPPKTTHTKTDYRRKEYDCPFSLSLRAREELRLPAQNIHTQNINIQKTITAGSSMTVLSLRAREESLSPAYCRRRRRQPSTDRACPRATATRTSREAWRRRLLSLRFHCGAARGHRPTGKSTRTEIKRELPT